MANFKSNGKLLLSGEYLVLDGAKALALPTFYGQQLLIEGNNTNSINWKSLDENNSIWFAAEFQCDTKGNFVDIDPKSKSNDVSKRLIQIFEVTKKLNPDFLKSNSGFDITTTQDFSRSWGLGTSSTLINNIANWANVDAYKLLELTFGGSGYDIACAQNQSAITYQLIDKNPLVTTVDFNPDFKDNIYFVYLNQKQNSRDGIAAYRNFKEDLKPAITEINGITDAMILCKNLKDFEMLLEIHENIISKIINLKPVKEELFNDFNGAVKSLGAWGGDFVMVTSNSDPTAYFEAKGFNTIIPFIKMIKS